MEAHFAECKRLKEKFDKKLRVERKANAELEEEIKKLEQSFEPTSKLAEDSNRKEQNQLDEGNQLDLDRLRDYWTGQLNEYETKARELIEFEEKLEDERENEIRGWIGDLNRKCTHILATCLGRRDELKIMRKELEVW